MNRVIGGLVRGNSRLGAWFVNGDQVVRCTLGGVGAGAW